MRIIICPSCCSAPLLFLLLLAFAFWPDHSVQSSDLQTDAMDDVPAGAAAEQSFSPLDNDVGGKRVRKPEDAIPVIEIRGEGKPMSAHQIRELEETSNGGPLDIKISNTFVPGTCARKARRLDFVTFHYKGFSETGKKFDQSYGREPNGIRIQLGVGMVMPGLDKGLKGMCDGELRKIEVPWRLSRKKKSKVWRFIPNDEHWLRFDVEMLTVEPWTVEAQFRLMDMNNDSRLMEPELVQFAERMRKDYGKAWPNEDIDSVFAARYYIKYFDVNGDGQVMLPEFQRVFQRDLTAMDAAKRANRSKSKAWAKDGKKRDPGLSWILDFNNDGIVSVQEMDAADQVLQGEPAILPKFETREEL